MCVVVMTVVAEAVEAGRNVTIMEMEVGSVLGVGLDVPSGAEDLFQLGRGYQFLWGGAGDDSSFGHAEDAVEVHGCPVQVVSHGD